MIETGGWKIKAAPFIIVDNQKVNIIGRNILLQLGIRLIQEKLKQENVLNIREQEQSNPEIIRVSNSCWKIKQSRNEKSIQ